MTIILSPLLLAVAILVAWRITWFLVFDSLMGFNLESTSAMSRRLDTFAYKADNNDRSFWRGKLGDLLTCPFCLGFWVSGVTAYVIAQTWPWDAGWNGCLTWVAVAGGQAALVSLARSS